MSILSNYPMSTLTTYLADYTKKASKRPEKPVTIRDYENPITGPYEEHILPYRKYNKLEKPTHYPDPKEYTDELCEKKPILKPHLKNPEGPDFEVVDRLYDNDNRTCYMIAYCRLGDYESKVSIARRRRPLPDGWEVPLTTHRYGYRDPRLILPSGLPPLRRSRLVDNLKPNEKERMILGVTTGESEYMAQIGKTGEEIIDGKLHGDVDIRPEFSQDDLLRAMLIRTT